MGKKTTGNKNDSKFKDGFYECDWLEFMRYNFIQNTLPEIIKDQEKIGKDIKNFHKADKWDAFVESCKKYTHIWCLTYFILGEYKKVFESAQDTSKMFGYHLTIPDYFYTYCWLSDNLVSFTLNNKDISELISHDFIVSAFDIERKKIDVIFEGFLKELTADTEPTKEFPNNGTENKGPVSETIELLIRKNKLLPKPDPETGLYTQSGSTPDTVAWIKLNNLRNIFPPKLFHAMIKTNCKPWIIEKYYRDL
jgi:hypothetical protein